MKKIIKLIISLILAFILANLIISLTGLVFKLIIIFLITSFVYNTINTAEDKIYETRYEEITDESENIIYENINKD